MMASCTTHSDLLRKKYRRWFGICLTTKDIFSLSFNNNALEKCTCGKALEVTFVGEDDVVSVQILSLSESASKRKIQLNNDKRSLDEGIEDDLTPAEGYRLVSMDSLLKFVKRIL